MISRRRLDLLICALAGAGFAGPSVCVASGADGEAPADSRAVLEEIVVTAEKRAESIQSLPIAISALSGDMLADGGIGNVHQLPQVAPSLQVGMKEGGHSRVAIRGIGSDLGVIADEPAVGVRQDGVPYSSLWFYNLDFFDVDRVEVLRGPQGTISGRNATAGAINIYSKRPTETFEGEVKATIGNFDRRAVEGILSGPLAGQRLLGRIAARTDRDNGWARDVVHGQRLGTTDEAQVRGSLLARITDQFEASLIVDHFRDRGEPLLFVQDGRARPDRPGITEVQDVAGFDRDAGTVAHDQLQRTRTEKDNVVLNMSWDIGASSKLTATSGYAHAETSYTPDTDGTTLPQTIFDLGADHPNDIGVTQLSQEMTLTTDLTDRLDLILGALYIRNKSTLDAVLGLPLAGVPLDGTTVFDIDQRLTSWAGYTQWRYRLTDTVRVTAGVRYTDDEKTYADQTFFRGVGPRGLRQEESWSAVTPRLAVDYMPSEDLTLYVSASRGFKSGGYATLSVPVNSFRPEYVWNYEIGAKSILLDGRLKTALTAFYMDYKDLQQALTGINPNSPPFSQVVVNANSATIQGVELELDALVTDSLRITAAGAWLDATYDELFSHDPLYPELGSPGGPFGVNLRDLSGNRLIRAPEWKFNVGAEYKRQLGERLEGALRASYAWQDDIYFNIFNNPLSSQSAYGLVDVSSSVESIDGRWEVSAFVNNLTDKYYRGQRGTPSVAGVRTGVAWPGLPRTYGLSVAFRF